AVPSIIAVIALMAVSRHSDLTLERRNHAGLSCLACAAGLASIGLFANHPAIAFTGLVVATAGPGCAGATVVRFPSMLCTGTAAAGGIALINSVGSFSGLVAPSIVGWLRDQTGHTAPGLYVVAVFEATAAFLIFRFMPRGRADAAMT